MTWKPKMLFFNFWKNFFAELSLSTNNLKMKQEIEKLRKQEKNRTTERFKILPPHSYFSDHLPTNSYWVSVSLEMNTSYLKLVMPFKTETTLKTANDRCFINFFLICKEDNEQTNMATRVDERQSIFGKLSKLILSNQKVNSK